MYWAAGFAAGSFLFIWHSAYRQNKNEK